MSNDKCKPNTSKKQIHIEKYNFDEFRKQQKPYVMILNDVIQRTPIKYAEAFLIWVYLESLPPTWKPNKKHIIERFGISERTYERYMSWLNATHLIEYRQIRDSEGLFGKSVLIVLDGSNFKPDAVSTRAAKIDGTVVNRLNKAQVVQLHRSAKLPMNGSAVERLNDAHINTTKNIKKEKEKERNTTSETPPPSTESSSSFFSSNEMLVLLSFMLTSDSRTKEVFLSHCEWHIKHPKVKMSRLQHVAGLKTILLKCKEAGEHFHATGYENEIQNNTPLRAPTKEEFDNWVKCVPGFEWVALWRKQQQSA